MVVRDAASVFEDGIPAVILYILVHLNNFVGRHLRVVEAKVNVDSSSSFVELGYSERGKDHVFIDIIPLAGVYQAF